MANYSIFCIHNPRLVRSKYPIALVGHVHEKWKIKKWYKTIIVNVGVDQWNYIPISFNEILRAINNFKRKEK